MRLPATIAARLLDPVRKELNDAREETLRGIAHADAGRQILRECIKPDALTPVGAPNPKIGRSEFGQNTCLRCRKL
jgi:hypothetical protein